jgi:hypothetical protein
VNEPLGIRWGKRFLFEIVFAVLIVVLFADYLFTSRMLYGSDMVPGGIFFRSLNVEFLKQFHQFPRWNPYILGGLPYLEATHGDTFFPSSILHFLFPVYRAVGHKLLLHIVLAGIFMMFFLRSLRLRKEAVVFGGLTYMLCPVFVSYIFAGQDGKMYVTSLTPLVLGLLERGMRSGSLQSFLLLGLAIGITILSAHIQMSYHLMWVVGALFLLRLLRGPATGEAPPARAKTSFLFVAAIAIALLVPAIQLLPAVTYVKNPANFSVRSTKTDYEHATSWSLHPEEIASMVVPEFCNAPRGYWGRNIFKYNSDSVGILALVLAGLALAKKRDTTRIFYASTAIVLLAYSLGSHTFVHRVFYALVPQVKLFRAPPLVMFLVAFSLVTLAALAVHDLASEPGRENKKGARPAKRSRFALVAYALAAVIFISGLAASGATSFWNDLFAPPLDPAKLAAQKANLPAFRMGAIFVALVLAAGTFVLEGWRQKKISPVWAVSILCLLTIADLWRVDRRFKVVLDPAPFIEPDPLVAQVILPASEGKYRVMPAVDRYSMNELGLFGIESTMGFHDNELAWYRELRMAPEAQGLLAANEKGYPFLRMLNVRFVLHNIPDLPNPFLVPNPLPRFWLADQYEVQPDRSRIPSRIADPAFDVARQVILESDPGFPSAPADTSAVVPGRILNYAYVANDINVEVETVRPSLLVHSENWFPYWHAYEMEGDRLGPELPILRANGALRAIALSPGKHTIALRYISRPFALGKLLTFSSAGLCIAGILLISLRKRARAHSSRDEKRAAGLPETEAQIPSR